MADAYVARQPIFDVKLNVVGYELLFRHKFVDQYDGLDGDCSTNSVIVNSFLLMGIERLTKGKKAFINFTANSIKNNTPGMLPKEFIAVEILEDVFPDEAIIKVCRQLKKDGYLLVLDDFVLLDKFAPLIPLIDIIKVDFCNTTEQERVAIVQRLKNYPVKFLAEKVESQEAFQWALQRGYSYFQGYFFGKPVIASHKEIPEYKGNYLRILQELNQPELNLNQIGRIIQKDLSLSYKLLKFINSPIFGFGLRICSLQQALVLLGEQELKKWISLIALKNIATDKPNELIVQSLIRAEFCKRLALRKLPKAFAEHTFLMGMFSYLDVLLERPLPEILNELHLAEELKQALLETPNHNNEFSLLYNLVISYEKGDWETCFYCIGKMGMAEHDVIEAYKAAVIWADNIVTGA
ncbi:MAG: HDOD domain-containing protein [Sporomusaceae bacterium]|nr:HDOD domain-containing protein [Sporomusaceae bacterium]